MPYLGKQAEEGGALISTYEFLQGTDTSTGTTAFTVSSQGGDYCRVFLNGVLLIEGGSNDYTKTNSAVTLASAPADGDILKIDIYESIKIWDTVSASGGGTFSGNVSFGGTVTMQSANNQGFAAGTKMLFQQTAAPTGWTKVTSSNDVALRVVSGSVGSGGSVAFETAFASQTIPVHTLAVGELPNHNHYIQTHTVSGSSEFTLDASGSGANPTGGSTGSVSQTHGGSHGHGSINLDVSYVDVIIATKD
tara:strand:+ start:395 stop:1141 length:747 start_codon:yes stop_codon:yes gene_type:complete